MAATIFDVMIEVFVLLILYGWGLIPLTLMALAWRHGTTRTFMRWSYGFGRGEREQLILLGDNRFKIRGAKPQPGQKSIYQDSTGETKMLKLNYSPVMDMAFNKAVDVIIEGENRTTNIRKLKEELSKETYDVNRHNEMISMEPLLSNEFYAGEAQERLLQKKKEEPGKWNLQTILIIVAIAGIAIAAVFTYMSMGTLNDIGTKLDGISGQIGNLVAAGGTVIAAGGAQATSQPQPGGSIEPA